MQITIGTVVSSKAGHDKGRFFAVTEIQGDIALIADGSSRTLSGPKKKKLIHLAPTKTVLSPELMNDDTNLMEALGQFNSRVRTF